jgi:hypothetical protein
MQLGQLKRRELMTLLGGARGRSLRAGNDCEHASAFARPC